MPSVWRIAANNTHLYPGARLRCLDALAEQAFRDGDCVVVEFSDGMAVSGEVVAIGSRSMTLSMQQHSTAHGARIPAKRWLVSTEAAPGTLRIKARD
jgi:hypothetical protein